MSVIESICTVIGAAVLLTIAAITVFVVFGLIGILIAEWRENVKMRKLYNKRMNGEE